MNNDALPPSKYGYGFGGGQEPGQDEAFQLLCESLSLLSRLSPVTTMNWSSNLGDYQTYSYGVDFAACMKERNAMDCLHYHLTTASNAASLTYEAVHNGSSSQSVTVIHNNAVACVRGVITFLHGLTDAGATNVDMLLLLIENRVFNVLSNSPLLKTSTKVWLSKSMGDEIMQPVTQRHRGYLNSQTSRLHTKGRPSSQEDPVHYVWRKVIEIFSSLVRSARAQMQTYDKVDEPIVVQLAQVMSISLDFLCTYENELFSCFSSLLNEARVPGNLSHRGKANSFSSNIHSSTSSFTLNVMKEAAEISKLLAELCKSNKREFARCSGIFERGRTASLELTKMLSSFLGSIGNARELFVVLASASNIINEQPSAMFDAHPLLSEGIPHARHEAIRNAHFAHSCCVPATMDDFTKSQISTTNAAGPSPDSRKEKSMEQSFQIQVNNKFIVEVEEAAGCCLFNALAILTDIHPASDSFITFTMDEALRLNMSAVITSGTVVAIRRRMGAEQYAQRFAVGDGLQDARCARAIACDRSTRTVSVEYADSNTVERHVPWSRIVGIEDVSKRKCIFSYMPTPKSLADADVRGKPSIGHIILALKWCRQVGSSASDNLDCVPVHIVKCVSERACALLCAEVLLHEELQGRPTSYNETARKINTELLDLFGTDDAQESVEKSSLAFAAGEDILKMIRANLNRQLKTAAEERDQEQKLWEENNTSSGGWDTSWVSSSKRQGRRSPFRLMRKTSSSGES